MQLRGLFMVIITLFLSWSSQVFANEPNSTRTLLVWGDSLSAAYGISTDEGWVQLLQSKLENTEGASDIKVVNGSVSGETTSGGLTRFPAHLDTYKPNFVILELGANDGLRGLSVKAMRSNLDQMIQMAQKSGAKVALLGMHMPANFGRLYREQYDKTFVDLAEQYQLPFNPFFLDGVALQEDLLLPDGLHPNAKAQPKLLDNIWPIVVELLDL
ncbi:arylesterase [Thiofilum flexile]|uniref:arylesterase n=1 Tax=Thiofilum flexile TaxID=125627 RepID=UPI00035CAB9A|nr:arylesterase [Thiofilum flexile]